MADSPIAAGLIVRAKDTGRVLLVQRSIDNKGYSAGQWEFPGGKLDDGDTPQQAAEREWEEEVGVPLPKGKIKGSYVTNDGKYAGFVYLIKHESDIQLSDTRTSLDGSGDSEIENVAWFDPKTLIDNPAVRLELQDSDWSTIGHAKAAAARIIMIDMDGTLTAAPAAFSQMLGALHDAGNYIAVVTGYEEGPATQEVWQQKLAHLQALDLGNCWDELVVIGGDVPTGKVNWCQQNGATVCIDNNVANAKALVAAGMPLVLVPWETKVKS